MDLAGKKALVTGSSRGIGRQIALKLAGAGADIVVNYPVEAEADNAQQVAEEIQDLGQQAVAVKADVTDKDEVSGMIEEMKEEFETIDIVVNNAGITRDTLLLRMDEAAWRQVIDVNLTGAFNVTQEVLRTMMKQRSGRIINISSVVGLRGNAGQANYSASKAGLIGLTKSTAQELAKRGVTVNAVAPGFIKTAMTDELDEKTKQEIIDEVPMNELGDPEDVADTVLFLASGAARYVTGEVIRVDGGMAM
jgi:3-oxoacyl-[acyl-carrier protein] reductase